MLRLLPIWLNLMQEGRRDRNWERKCGGCKTCFLGFLRVKFIITSLIVETVYLIIIFVHYIFFGKPLALAQPSTYKQEQIFYGKIDNHEIGQNVDNTKKALPSQDAINF